MDRNIVYPSSIPQDVDILNPNRNAMVAIGYLLQATLGTNVIVDGLTCLPATTGLGVVIGPGSSTQLTTIDPMSYGSFGADTADPLMKMGINISPVVLNLSAPVTPGLSMNYLIEAVFSEYDSNPAVLPYVNAANPNQPFSGPSNSGGAQNTLRLQRVVLQAVAGDATTSGTQPTPTPDAGYVGLFVVTVAYGQTAVVGSNIAPLPTAPFIPWKLPTLSPGVSRMAVITSSEPWIVPAAVTRIKARLWGAGGGGGAGGGLGYVGGGGAGGGYVEAFFGVTPGQVLTLSVGVGGTASVDGGAGGPTSLDVLATAGGGSSGTVGGAGAVGVGGGSPGSASAPGAIGTPYLVTGLVGQNGIANGSGLIGGGSGGADGRLGAFGPAGTTATSVTGGSPSYPGSGGTGGVGNGGGGNGASGQITIEW
jgi:hypothetical protein